jgi:polynucleotide 5'-kinase involved in rRNA processing
MLIECLRLAKPDRVLAPIELKASLPLPFSVYWVEGLPASATSHAQAAKRRGRWIECLESCETHSLNLAEVKIEGTRLGSGVPTPNLGGGIHYAESCGGTLLLAARDALDDHAVAEALDTAHARRAVVVNPSHYIGLVCSFAKEDGTDFGIGRLTDIDFASQVLTCRTTAVAPAKVPVLKLGGMRIDETGRELPAPVPWSF